MDKEKYIALYEKMLAGECTEQEKALLHKYQDNFDFKEHAWQEEMGDKDEIKKHIYNRLNEGIHARKRPVLGGILKWSAAASIVLAVVFGWY